MSTDDSNQPTPSVFEKRSITIHVGAVVAAYAVNGMQVSCRIHRSRVPGKDEWKWTGSVDGALRDGISFVGGIAESIWQDYVDDESSDIADVDIEDLERCLSRFLALGVEGYDSRLTSDTFNTLYRIRGLVKVIVDELIAKQSLSRSEVGSLCGNWMRDTGYVPPDE
ncbi:MAG: hypothetical protein QGG71_26975 [Pirellulaceae bacterium]|jgi:hypothetical protein|nr:hypothetical protein [Pirellulaceae bacterium]